MHKKEFKYPHKPIASIASLARLLCENPKNKPPYIVTEEQLQYYVKNSHRYYSVYKKIQKKDGSIRLIYSVKKEFKKVLARIRVAILDEIILPDYIVGGVKGASAVTNAKTHASPSFLVAEDITNFFPSVSIDQVNRVFQHCCHFPPDTSEFLAKLCTHNGFLVQGSPVSGHLANLVFFFIEPKVVAWLKNRGLTYSRLYDDINISSKERNFHKEISQIKAAIYNMFDSVGVKANLAKRKIMSSSNRVVIHNITANTEKLSPSLKKISNVRIEVFSFERFVLNEDNIEIIIDKYRSVRGKINNIKQQEYRHWEKYQAKLDEALNSIDQQEIKKFFRKLRKVKTRREYLRLRSKISVLKKIAPELNMIADLEAKAALAKIKKKEALFEHTR